MSERSKSSRTGTGRAAAKQGLSGFHSSPSHTQTQPPLRLRPSRQPRAGNSSGRQSRRRSQGDTGLAAQDLSEGSSRRVIVSPFGKSPA